MVVTLAIAVMIVAAVAIVAWPFFGENREFDSAFATGGDPALENLVVQRDAAYAAIKDLEFDHEMGKLSDGDYKAMRTKYESKAVAILQELDGVSASNKQARIASGDEIIERQVRELRRGASSARNKCARCGTPHGPDEAFCAKCGTSLRGARCPNCGTRAAPGDKFCARCGMRISG